MDIKALWESWFFYQTRKYLIYR